MKNTQKTLSTSTSLVARVALRAMISKSWHYRRKSQQTRNVSSIHFWSKDIKQSVSALREMRNF